MSHYICPMRQYEVRFIKDGIAHETVVTADTFIEAVSEALKLNIIDDDIVSITDLS